MLFSLKFVSLDSYRMMLSYFYTLEITDRDLRVVDDIKWLFLMISHSHFLFIFAC